MSGAADANQSILSRRNFLAAAAAAGVRSVTGASPLRAADAAPPTAGNPAGADAAAARAGNPVDSASGTPIRWGIIGTGTRGAGTHIPHAAGTRSRGREDGTHLLDGTTALGGSRSASVPLRRRRPAGRRDEPVQAFSAVPSGTEPSAR